MFDTIKFNQVPKYVEFQYWFERIGDDVWRVINKETSEQVCKYTWPGTPETAVDGISNKDELDPVTITNIVADFMKFRLRPEYTVGRKVSVADMDAETAVTVYETLITGIAFIRSKASGVDPDTIWNKVDTGILTWLRNGDMYTAPASTQYHESFTGGLLYHTLKVYNAIIDLTTLPQFQTVSVESAALIALVHDWCKIGLYESYNRNVKNDVTGKWEQVEAFRTNQKGVPLGPGVSSMFLASKCFRLSTDEALAIRWHMGAWRVAESEYNEFQLANETVPHVHLIQFADQLSIVKY